MLCCCVASQVLKRSGTEQEKKHARRIMPVSATLQLALLNTKCTSPARLAWQCHLSCAEGWQPWCCRHQPKPQSGTHRHSSYRTNLNTQQLTADRLSEHLNAFVRRVLCR